MAVQVCVRLDEETHRTVAYHWRTAVIQLGTYFGDLQPDWIPDFSQYSDPEFEVQAFLMRVGPGAHVHTVNAPVFSSMGEAIEEMKTFQCGYQLRGGTPEDQRLMWARLVEETSTYVTVRDALGHRSGQSGNMVRAEYGDTEDREARVVEVVAEMGMTLYDPRLPEGQSEYFQALMDREREAHKDEWGMER